MQKQVFVLWRPDDLGPDAFRDSLLGETLERLRKAGAWALSLSVVDCEAERLERARIGRLDPPPSAVLSFRLESEGAGDACDAALSAVSSRRAGYLVDESVPLANTTHAVSPGMRTPGINMVSLRERPPGMAREAWVESWRAHEAVALATQCTYAYVKNLVVRPLTAGAPDWSGIVEEGFPTEAVTDPMLWYRADGSRETLERNLSRMLESCRSFLDLQRVESHPMSEYRFDEILDSGIDGAADA